MKRLHVHVSVDDLEQSLRFYATLFAAGPTVLKQDYAKWVLEDPRVNFAISRRGGPTGIRHLGIQVEDEDELGEVYARLEQAEGPVVEQKATTCCYAKSDKQWIADPQGVTWETFLTHGDATVYGHGRSIAKPEEAKARACGEPAPAAPAATSSPAAAGCGCAR
jgi:catechol 2,3-dioxygenase-like lactoylglutathione lyase family enzyme